MSYTDVLSYFQAYAGQTKNFSLCLGTPLENGTPTIYIHPADVDGDTINLAIVPGHLSITLTPLQQNQDGSFNVVTEPIPSGDFTSTDIPAEG